MKILLSIVVGVCVLIPQQLSAHGDHDHVHDFYLPQIISESVAVIIAQRAASRMSKTDVGLGFGQLSESWSAIPDDGLSIYKKGSGYYVVSVRNDTEKKTLFVLMSNVGEVYDANHSGEFKGI